MRKLQCILLLFVLITLMMGCIHRVDRRLVLADTLMWTAPDSSLAILNTINRDSLPNDESRAYHALLLTQAQFRNYITLTSDSLISTAVDFYSDNHNREHYTRTLIYKGAAFEDMGNPVEAMKWYKLAEDNADTADYRNLALANIRMGDIYYSNYAGNNLDLEKYKKALKYYEILGDKRMMVGSLKSIANILRISDRPGAYRYYDRAENIASELGDSVKLYSIFVSKALTYYVDSLVNKAKDYMLKALSIKNVNADNCDFYIFSLIYSKLNMIDSAQYYLNKPDTATDTPYDRLMRYKSLVSIELSKGDNSNAYVDQKTYKSLLDSLDYNSIKYSLLEYENVFNDNRILDKSNSINRQRMIIIMLVFVFLLATLIFCVVYYKNKKDLMRLISDLRKESFSKYEELRRTLGDFDDHFSQTLNLKLKTFEDIMSGAYNEQHEYLNKEIAHRITPIDDSDEMFWDGLFSYLNLKYNGVMDRIIKDFPQLSKADVNFIGLMCCGFSDAAIAVCKHYRNVDSVRSRRRKIRDKMGIDGNLINYVKKMTK